MKIKIDYVTNSSSASFLLYIESTARDEEEFIESFNKFLEDYNEENRWKKNHRNVSFINPKEIRQISSGVFIVEDWITMYNDYDDIPNYIKYLILRHIIDNNLIQYGIKDLKFEIKGDR